MNQWRAHGRRLRIGRFSEAGRIYFVTSCCCNKANVFADHELAQILVAESRYQEEINGCSSLAFVAMPDHFHWLVQIGEQSTLQQVVGSLKGRAARAINVARSRSGQIWQAGFHDHALRREEDLENLAHYLLRNPVRAGLVKTIEEYPFSYSIWHPCVAGRA